MRCWHLPIQLQEQMLLPASLLLLVFLSMLASLLCSCVPAIVSVCDVLISALSVVPAFQAPLLLLTPYCCKCPCYCQLVMNAYFPACYECLLPSWCLTCRWRPCHCQLFMNAGFPDDACPAADVPAIASLLWMLTSQLVLDLLLTSLPLPTFYECWLPSWCLTCCMLTSLPLLELES